MFNFLFTKTPLVFFVQSFWRDEAFSYLLAKRNFFDLLFLTAKDFNPPLYYIVLHIWIKFFGSSEIALRSISFIFYWLTVYCSFLFLTGILKITTKRVWIYLLLIALNPVLIYYGFEARMYTMLAFLATLSFYSFIRNDYKTFFITTLLGLYTHYFMIFVLFGELLFHFIIMKKRTTGKILLKYLLPFFFFVPWIVYTIRIKEVILDSFWIPKVHLNTLFHLLGIVYTGYEYDTKLMYKPITVVSFILLLFVGFGLYYLRKNHTINKKILWYLLIWGIGIPFFILSLSVFKSLFLPRYFIFCTVGIILLFIYLLDHFPLRFRYGFLIILLLAAILSNKYQVEERKKSDLRGVFKKIRYLAKPGDVVYVTNELNFFVAQYYFDENRVYIYGKRYDTTPNYVGKILMPPSKFVNTLPVYPKKAFILTSDSHYDIQAAQ